MTSVTGIASNRRMAPRFALWVTIAGVLLFGVPIGSAGADERRDDRRDEGRGGEHHGWDRRGEQDHGWEHRREENRGWDQRGDRNRDGGWGGGYYRGPPVVFGGPGYFPPPVVYRPFIGILTPGLGIGIQ